MAIVCYSGIITRQREVRIMKFDIMKDSKLAVYAIRELPESDDRLIIKVAGMQVYASVNHNSGFIENYHHATIRAIINDALKGYNARVVGRRKLYGISHYSGVMYRLEELA